MTINNKSWLPHDNINTSCANHTRQLLQMNLRDCKKDIKLRCYRVYVRPVVEYVSAICDSSNKTAINKIENVHRKAARCNFQTYRKESTVTKMLKDSQLDTLKLWRKIQKLISLHSIVNGKTYLSPENTPVKAPCQSSCTGPC